MAKTITYEQLARRLDELKLFNKAPELDPEILDNLQNGSDGYCSKHEECDEERPDCVIERPEVYQWYLIGPLDARYLKRNTDELVFYSEVLDEYVWGITHYGTAWDSVTTEIKEL